MAIITPALCRAARGLLGWNQEDLAKAATIALNTLRNFEAGKSVPMTNNLAAIQTSLEAAGVMFIPENGGGAGLRLRKPGSTARAEDPEHPTLRSVGPEDEDRAGPEAPDTTDLAIDGK
jgi:transcriptional regulator with XRE-family HTH domain